MQVVALTGKGGGKLAYLADAEIRVPHNGYADRIQEIHIKVIHIFIYLIEKFLQQYIVCLQKLSAAAVYGVNAILITIEVNVGQGTKFFMVGLPDSAVKESEQRVESALKATWLQNAAPEGGGKHGAGRYKKGRLGLRSAHCSGDPAGLGRSWRLPNWKSYVIMGELALDGSLRPIKGVLPIAIEARKQGFKGFILPQENASEAAIVNNIDIIGVTDIQQAVRFFSGKEEIKPLTVQDTRDIFFSRAR